MGNIQAPPVTNTEHHAIMSAGWSYRMNDRGWIIYRNPKTGSWHTRLDAIAILGESPEIEAQ